MYHIRGFSANVGLVNNTSRTVAKVGELSGYAATFARDRLIFSNPTTPLATLFVFETYNEVSATEIEVRPVPDTIAQTSLAISQAIYQIHADGDWTSDKDLVRDYILNNWPNQVQNVTVGAMVHDGLQWMPSSVTWEGTSQTNPYRATFWFSDESFRNEFDGYEIELAFPIGNIDDLFATPAEMDLILSQRLTNARVTQAISDVSDGDPFTDPITDEFEWLSAADQTVVKILPITVIIYGDAGRSPDIRRKAIADWILANSVHDEDSWRAILPDVFSPTEFIIAPAWNRYSIPSGTITDWTSGTYPEGVLSAGTYSPGGNAHQQVEFMKDFAKGVGYTDTYVENNTNLVTFVYKSVQAAIVGGFRNRNGVNQFLDRWPDYMAVGTGSIDFNRISEETQEMVNLVIDMMRVAETMTVTSSIPRKYTRTIRDGVLYLTATFKRTQLLVVSRNTVAGIYKYTKGATNEKW